ncbi:glycoside hydrolase family 65 protein [Pseudoclavibacter sp. CFCC 13796]|uniref:glycoside hydrolase family 65 protein n=1 Tax=Pseudoclavibacter sp. CFCC 13796 TaxID=2615179 RepID=UPI0013018326|nr:glycosyl hydrolase family 65 protein [Pseudoclavibacter sp. CFCC 13796]KAB1661957.1 glycoside hydrolase family 65 protein [Pseudoclavibacter sp. CFCC 13796]
MTTSGRLALGREWSPTDIDRTRFRIDEWGLREDRFNVDDIGITETLFAVSNGYIGFRGNFSEGRSSYEQGTYVSGLHETWEIRHAEEAFGFAKVGQSMINAPDARPIRVYVDDEPFIPDKAEIVDYHRRLDFRTGQLTRDLVWRTPAGKRVRITSSRLVSFTQRHLALLTLTVTMLEGDAPIAISCQIMNRQDGEDDFGVRQHALGKGIEPRKAKQFEHRVFLPRYRMQNDQRSVLGYRVAESGQTIAVAADHLIETRNAYRSSHTITDDLARNVFEVDAREGVPTTVTKFVTYHTSNGYPVQELVDRCVRSLSRAHEYGADGLRRQQRRWLDAFWERSDVRIPGQPVIQQAVRWNLFQLIQASARAEGWGVPAKGLTGSGYSGHYFWDTEVFVLPFLSYTNPDVARNALRFRVQMLPQARQRAEQLGVEGALFPWRTINGEESSAYYAAGTAQYHLDADITYAIAKYMGATSDYEFLAREAIDVVVETARMWASLGFWRGKNGERSFNIHGVTGPDEYTTVVNNNLFTNAMAQFNLRYAVSALEQISQLRPDDALRARERLAVTDDEIRRWELIADRMELPFDEHFGIHPQDEQFLNREIWDVENTPPEQRPLLLHFHPLVIYRFQVVKQADVVLALYLRSDLFSDAEKRADFEYYEPLTTGDSTLSAGVQSIVAAEVGYQELAYDHFMCSLFTDLDNLHRNTEDGAHIASAGGIWSTIVSGFGGLRDVGGVLRFDPRLPAGWQELSFPLAQAGTRVRFTVTRDTFFAEVEEGTQLTFWVRAQRFVVRAGEPVSVVLDGQGPIIEGEPDIDQLEGFRREDGTLLTTSIPVVTSEIPIVHGSVSA